MDMADMNFDIKPTDDYVFKRLFGDDENKKKLLSGDFFGFIKME